MSDRDFDPTASTQMFRAFVERGETEQPARAGVNRGVLIAAAIAVVALALIAWLVLA